MMVLEWIRFLAGAVCMAAGLVFYIIQFIGVFRFKYVLNRMHAAAIGDTLGCGQCCWVRWFSMGSPSRVLRSCS